MAAANAHPHFRPKDYPSFETCHLLFFTRGRQLPTPDALSHPLYLGPPNSLADLRASPPILFLWASVLSVSLTPDPLTSWVLSSPSKADHHSSPISSLPGTHLSV